MNGRQVIQGPALIRFNDYTYYSEGEITLTPELGERVITSSWHGPVSRRQTDRAITLAFTPVGMLDSAAAYCPFGPADLGSLLAPAVDADVDIYTAAGVRLTLKAGVITRPPQLILAADKGPLGQMSITAMGGLAKAAGSDSSVWEALSATIGAHTLDPFRILTPGYTAELIEVGGTAQDPTETVLHSFDPLEGVTFDTGATVTPVRVNAYGTVNYRLDAIDPRAEFAAAALSESDLLSLMLLQGDAAGGIGSGATLGLRFRVLPAFGKKGITVEFADCTLTAPMSFGAATARSGTIVVRPVYVPGKPLYAVYFPDFSSQN